MSEGIRPFWTLAKEDQKRLLEAEIKPFLGIEGAELTNSQKYFLRETLAHMLAGRYQLACDSMDDVYLPPAEVTGCAEILELHKSVTRQALVRAFRYIKGTPVRAYPTFR
jgi:hypothetical protein